MKSAICSSKSGYTSITCSKIEHIPYNLIFTTTFNDSWILITIISWDYLNLLLASEYIGNVTIPTQVIKYNQNCLQADQPIRLQYSHQINKTSKHISPQIIDPWHRDRHKYMAWLNRTMGSQSTPLIIVVYIKNIHVCLMWHTNH